MTDAPSIVLFQTDLRLADNPAVTAAVRRGSPLLCVYVWNPHATGYDRPGAASRWWLHHSLQSLATTLRQAGNALILRRGTSEEVLRDILKTYQAPHVFWNRTCEPSAVTNEQTLMKILADHEAPHTAFHGTGLIDPSALRTQSGTPYRVFTPFWRTLQMYLPVSSPLPTPKHLPPPPSGASTSDTLAHLNLLPRIDWAQGLRATWTPGEKGAYTALNHFFRNPVTDYQLDRDRPDLPHTSRLSPHLHFGELSPRSLWYAITQARKKARTPKERNSVDAFARQLGWREFARYLLYHFPHTVQEPLDSTYHSFPWEQDEASCQAWQHGLTGYPLVDAGMRELWQTGWMHNRVRMITASFLTKDLLLSWQEGAAWFWDTLVDADLANNTLGWQWVAGCGADASPFFRIFNPVTQGLKFDPNGLYVRTWVPELAELPSRWIHEPWKAPPDVLMEANVSLGHTYPYPMVDHVKARERSLLTYKNFSRGKQVGSANTPRSPRKATR